MRLSRKSGRATQQPVPVGGLCEYMDAGGGIAFARVEGAGRATQLTVSAGGSEMAFSLVSDAIADGRRTATFAGPLYMLNEPGASAILRGSDGEASLEVKAADRICEPSERFDADAAGELESLRLRCEASERALAEMRTAGADESPRLVKAWREAAELRDALDLREDVHRDARREARTLHKRVAQLESELERLEHYATGLEKAAEEHERASEAMRSRLDFARYAAREGKRRDLRLRSELERLRRVVEAERAHRDFARHSLREGKRREIELRREIAATRGDAVALPAADRPEPLAVSVAAPRRRRSRRRRHR